MRSDQHLQTADERRHEETRHTPMHAVRHPTVVPFTKFIREIRIRDGIAEASEILAIVTHNVAVMECDDLALASGQNITVGRPTPAPLALVSDVDFM